MLWFSATVVSRNSGGFPCSVHSFVAGFCRRRLSMDRKRADQAPGRFTWKGLKIRKASPLDSNACWWNQPDLMLVQMVPAWSGAQTAARSGAYCSHTYTALTHAALIYRFNRKVGTVGCKLGGKAFWMLDDTGARSHTCWSHTYCSHAHCLHACCPLTHMLPSCILHPHILLSHILLSHRCSRDFYGSCHALQH